MSGLTSTQQDRVSAYRRRRAPDSQSDSQARPWGDVQGHNRPLDSQHQSAMQATPSRQGGPFGDVMRQNFTGTTSAEAPGFDQPPGPSPPPVRRSDTAPAFDPAGGAGAPQPPQPPQQQPGGGYHDMDIRSYIFDLELQNRELRKQVADLQSANENALPATAALVNGSEDAKREFLTNVLSQVEAIVEAHRNKANADIHKYKTEAEQSRNALEQLRAVIQNEGLDLTLAPALISFHRRQKDLAAKGRSAEPMPLGINFPPEVDTMLHEVAREILVKLQGVTERDQLGSTMREAVRTGFQSVIVHFTDELVAVAKRNELKLVTLEEELDAARKENRMLQLGHESKRVEMATEHQLEMDALRDEIRVLTGNSSSARGSSGRGGHDNNGDSLTNAMHEKAFAEYAQLLVEARRDAANARAELDAEKNKSAEVCLKLKSTLERRRVEYENEIVAKAEEVVTQRDRLVKELEARLRSREAEFAKREQREFSCQAGEPLVGMPEKENFVPQILAGIHRDSRAAAQSSELYEREVWKKAQELLSKYGNGGGGGGGHNASTVSSSSATRR